MSEGKIRVELTSLFQRLDAWTLEFFNEKANKLIRS